MKLTKRPAYAAHVPIRIAMYRRETSCYSAQEELGRETLCRSAQEELCGEILCQSVQEEPCEMQAVDAAGEYMLVAVYQEEDSNLAQFDRMMADAARNCFDYILAESVSSFGGSTGAALSAIRTLGVNHIGVMFSRENIDTFSEEDQKLLDVIAAFEEKKHREHAQAIHRAIRKNFASGKPRANLNRMLGYDFAEDGRTWIINEEQAGTVRYIFNSFVEGMSANQIARNLNKAGVETVAGSVWRADTVIGVLRNEKYAGDVEMQKTVSASSYMPVANTGQAPKYYQTNHHAAIIDRDLWDRVQAMVRNFGPRNPQIKTRKSGTVFGRLTCGYCGGSLQRFGYSAVIERYSDARSLAAEGVTGEEAKSFSEQYAISYSVWRCENKYKGHEGKSGRLSQSELAASEGCRDSRILHETALEQSFMEMLYRMKYDYQKKGEKCTFACDFRKAYSDVYESLGGTGSHFLQIDALEERIGTLTGQLAAVRSRLEKISPDKMSQPAREEASKGRSPLAGENTTPSASKEILPLAGENVSFSGPKGRSP
ncbi:MAG: recombinase family protein, partial [Lachnospiraceae bacterium]|nr:recombinase family protein [Lachnospiraceae bacterium]